jgi:hypothetical protein
MFDVAAINEGESNMAQLASTVREVASEGQTSMRTILLSVSGGRYTLRSDLDSLFFNYQAAPGTVQPKVYARYGDVKMLTCTVGGKVNIDMKLNYSWANFTGGNNTIATRGTNRICVEDIGRSGNQTVMSVRRC